jgi:predicted GNAT family acetyltransferase
MESLEVKNNRSKNQFEANLNGKTALIKYRKEADGTLDLFHTEVPDEFEGRGVGSQLVKAALEQIKADDLKINPSCPFIAAYIKRHPEYRNLVK